MIKDIFELQPQMTEVQSGTEPSLREILECYYQPFFPETCEQLAQEYIEKIIEISQ